MNSTNAVICRKSGQRGQEAGKVREVVGGISASSWELGRFEEIRRDAVRLPASPTVQATLVFRKQ